MTVEILRNGDYVTDAPCSDIWHLAKLDDGEIIASSDWLWPWTWADNIHARIVGNKQ